MERELGQIEDEGGVSQLEETGGQAEGRSSKLSRFIKLQTYQPLKEVLSLDEIRLKFMRQGQDVSRSRLISEAIKLLAKQVAEGKFELRG